MGRDLTLKESPQAVSLAFRELQSESQTKALDSGKLHEFVAKYFDDPDG